MFKLPAIEKCKENEQRLIKKLLAVTNKHISSQQISEAKDFFQNWFLFHHFIVDFSWKTFIDQEIIPDTLLDGTLKSNAYLKKLNFKTEHERTYKEDIYLNLDQHVFLTFGVPLAQPASSAFILVFPFKTIAANYQHPNTWSTLKDIELLTEDIFGLDYLYKKEEILKNHLEKLFNSYIDIIITTENLPSFVAHYALTHYQNYVDVILKEWYIPGSTQREIPEIKIEKELPLKLASHCLIDDHNSNAGKLAALLYKEGILSHECKIQKYFNWEKALNSYITGYIAE